MIAGRLSFCLQNCRRGHVPESNGLADDFVEFFFGGAAAEGEGAGEVFPIVEEISMNGYRSPWTDNPPMRTLWSGAEKVKRTSRAGASHSGGANRARLES